MLKHLTIFTLMVSLPLSTFGFAQQEPTPEQQAQQALQAFQNGEYSLATYTALLNAKQALALAQRTHKVASHMLLFGNATTGLGIVTGALSALMYGWSFAFGTYGAVVLLAEMGPFPVLLPGITLAALGFGLYLRFSANRARKQYTQSLQSLINQIDSAVDQLQPQLESQQP
ncbi:MAG: hypothetical protein HYY16_09700 [Planctomycetes bacterium]|nr:hypothetical protein [Planctomycetota bacterium]